MSQHEVLAFFSRYRQAFNRLDGDAVADLWHTPSAIADTAHGASHARATAWCDDTPMRANMRALCNVYRGSGYHDADFELAGHLPLGRDQSFVQLRWTLRRHDGSVLQAFGTGCHLLRADDGIRVFAAAAFEEDLCTLARPHAAH